MTTRTTGRRWESGFTVLALALLAACSSGSGGTVESSASSAAGAGAGSGGLGALASALASASSKAAGSSLRTVGAGDALQFSTPSKNIGCYVTHDDVRCDIADKSWTVPKLAGCELDYGNGISVVDSGPAQIVCAGDTVLGGSTVIAYDHGVEAGDFQCLVNKAGVTCRNTATGHGFTLSREAHTEF